MLELYEMVEATLTQKNGTYVNPFYLFKVSTTNLEPSV